VTVPTYIAFLRAINLGAKRKFAKADIIKAVESIGATDVETHINTGNVRFDLPERSRAKVEAALEKAFEADRGFEVPTIVFTPQEMCAIVEDADRLTRDHEQSGGRHYVSLLKQKPTAAAMEKLNEYAAEGERAESGGRAVHLLLGPDYHTAKLTNAPVEKHLGVATNRNVTVIRKVAEKWCGD
jgi:uncharacterized protein (DUF1697 family)